MKPKMKTPIYDFVQKYACSDVLRLHMPGHKGKGENPSYALDITEIEGAGALYSESGIIAQSEKNASSLFGHPTFYSAEGSSQCIKAMLFLCRMYIDEMKPRRRGKMLVAAGRNAHSAFISAAALTDFDIMWIYPEKDEKNGANGFLSCRTAPADIERALVSCHKIPDALYITSPDYLGNIQDIGAISEICKKHGILLLVDNAHGAYLRFLPRSLHPMDLGADMCCDSAHKTLPVLTGGAYLHISRRLPESIEGCAKKALLLFGSTSPSYLILASLDHANLVLLESFRENHTPALPVL